jgi:hypothetical protein
VRGVRRAGVEGLRDEAKAGEGVEGLRGQVMWWVGLDPGGVSTRAGALMLLHTVRQWLAAGRAITNSGPVLNPDRAHPSTRASLPFHLPLPPAFSLDEGPDPTSPPPPLRWRS